MFLRGCHGDIHMSHRWSTMGFPHVPFSIRLRLWANGLSEVSLFHRRCKGFLPNDFRSESSYDLAKIILARDASVWVGAIVIRSRWVTFCLNDGMRWRILSAGVWTFLGNTECTGPCGITKWSLCEVSSTYGSYNDIYVWCGLVSKKILKSQWHSECMKIFDEAGPSLYDVSSRVIGHSECRSEIQVHEMKMNEFPSAGWCAVLPTIHW